MGDIIVLCSGNLGASILKYIYPKHKISFVFTDKNSSSVIDYCKVAKIPFYAGNPRFKNASHIINKLKCEVLLSVNYLFIVDENLLSIASKYAINLHGSLLPKYRGRTPHVWSIINGEKETGITAHLMTTKVDYGKIVKQMRIPISDTDTGYSILEKFENIYPTIIDDVITDIINENIVPVEQDHSKSTFFGKRTPEDGEINWDWQKERIRNWIRAQAHPYPGAYTFYKGEKLIIHKIEFSENGFHYNDPNGLILETSPQIVVKTSNGAIKIIKMETIVKNFEKGTILCPK